MKKRAAIVVCVVAMSCCSGCSKNVDQIDFQSADEQTIVTEDASDMGNATSEDAEKKDLAEDKKNTENNSESIQAEIEKVEEKSKEFEVADWGELTQTDMNIKSEEWYKLWDEELNSLWSRLSNEVDAETKDKLLEEQREWIKRKDANIEAVCKESMGGSIAPLLANTVAEEMTRARAYKLAGYLAEQRNESFTIPDYIQESIDMADPSLDDVFRDFEGQWIFDAQRGACVGVERTESCAYGVEGSNWTVWVTGGDILSDLDVYDYTANTITFKKEHEGYDDYYKLSFNMANAVTLEYGTSLDAMDDVIVCDEQQ